MATPKEILRTMSPDRFTEVVSASPRKVREELYRRLGLKPKKNSAFALKKAEDDDRSGRLLAAIQNGEAVADEVLEELIRSYLSFRRELLADALDHFEIPHENGLTDQEIDFLSELPKDKATALRKLLLSKHQPADVDLYFAYMNIPS
jgi:hypothetical protein